MGRGNHTIKERSQAVNKKLGNNLADNIAQTDRPIIFDCLRILNLRDENNIVLLIPSSIIPIFLLLNSLHNIIFVGGNDTYGTTRIPTTVDRARGCAKSGSRRSTQGDFTQVRAAEMRNTLVLLRCVFERS